MRQLLIVNSAATVPSGSVDLSALTAGQLGTFELGAKTYATALPTKNFGIALGRGNNSPAFIIPEVDVDTLTVQMANPTKGSGTNAFDPAGVAFTAKITVPTTIEVGRNYTVVLVKKGIQFNERSNYTVTTFVTKTTTTAAEIATDLANQLQAMADAGTLNITAQAAGAVITVTGLNKGEQFALKGGDALMGCETGDATEAQPVIFDKAAIQDLASRCAAGKGFEYRYKSGEYIYPGDPEAIEDTTYALITLRFAVGRAASKQRDERVWQVVYIAVPTAKYTAFSALFALAEDGGE